MGKYLITLLITVFIIGCKSENDFEEIKKKSFTEFSEVSFLKDFRKVSDTSYVRNGQEISHRITEYLGEDKILVVFSKITLDSLNEEHLKILDTITIKKDSTYLSIGYCNYENSLPEEIIAMKSSKVSDTLKNVIRAWKANFKTNNIEEIENLEEISCLDQFEI